MDTRDIKHFKDVIDSIQLEAGGPTPTAGQLSAAVRFLRHNIAATETNYYKVLTMLKHDIPGISAEDAKNAISQVFPGTQLAKGVDNWLSNLANKIPPSATLSAALGVAGAAVYGVKTIASNIAQAGSDAMSSVKKFAGDISGGSSSSAQQMEFTPDEKQIMREMIDELKQYEDEDSRVPKMIKQLEDAIGD